MKEFLTSNSVKVVFVCLLSGLLPVACSHHPESDIILQQRLVGTWRFSRSDGTVAVLPPSDMTFTITSNGGYISRITNPQAHTLEGTAEVKNGILIVTVTNRDNATAPSPLVDRQTIVRFDQGELGIRSEGSNITNVFQKNPQ